MPRIRAIKHDLYLDEELAQLPVLCRYAFPGLWTLADREGRLEDRPARIKAQLFPYEPGIDMDDVLATLAAAGFVIRYEVGGARYLQVRSFTKHQQVNARETKSQIPAPPGHVAPPPAAPAEGDDTATDTDVHVHARAVPCMHVGKGREGNGIQGRDLPPTPQGVSAGGDAQAIADTAPALPRLVPRPSGQRQHPLDEDQTQAAPDVQQRAALWLERFAGLHLTRRGSRYLTKPQRDFEPAVRLVRAYADAEMDALTALYLDASGIGFDDKPRTPGHLAHVAPMLEERLKEVGQWPSAA